MPKTEHLLRSKSPSLLRRASNTIPTMLTILSAILCARAVPENLISLASNLSYMNTCYLLS